MAELNERDHSTRPAPDPGVRSLREVRAERLLSIRELARTAGVAPSTIYLIEAGRTIPHGSVIRKITAVVGVEPLDVAEFRRAIEVHRDPR